MAMGGASSPPRSSSSNAASTAVATSTGGPRFRVGMATTSPEFVAVILAATHGANLFPLTAPCSSSETSNHDSTATATTCLPPKHLLPLAGVSLLHRLILCLQQSGGFADIVVCIAHDDQVTIPSLLQDTKGGWKVDATHDDHVVAAAATAAATTTTGKSPVVILQQQEIDTTNSGGAGLWNLSAQPRLVIVRLPVGDVAAGGSVDALRHIEATNVISKHSHVVVFPSDLVILNGTAAIQQFVQAHRQGQQESQNPQEPGCSRRSNSQICSSAACTVLLAEVGEEDENGIPLKESAKQKKGGLAREEEAIEYTALAYDVDTNDNGKNNATTTPRLIWKQSKFDVESDEHFTGDTPKLVLPKPRLRLGSTSGRGGTTTTVKVQMNWNDLHVYILSPWVRRLITTRTSLLSIQDDLIPLLIARQTKGICATFGSKMDKIKVHDILRNNHNHGSGVLMDNDDAANLSLAHPPSPTSPGLLSNVPRTSSTSSSSEKQGGEATMGLDWLTSEYTVLAHVIPGAAAVRANSIPAFLHASKELVAHAIVSGAAPPSLLRNPCLPPNSTIRAKAQSIILPETTHDMLGDKITFKSSIVGRYCKVGTKCRLNNVILFDHVTLGDNCIVQNTIIGPGAVIGDNCSLNDCQVAPSKVVAAGTKHKGEALLLDDDDNHGHDHNHDHGDCWSKLRSVKI
jgi:carbonic anhydrase/acetyltransferase-like protein (isoleucine patch superfamily)